MFSLNSMHYVRMLQVEKIKILLDSLRFLLNVAHVFGMVESTPSTLSFSIKFQVTQELHF